MMIQSFIHTLHEEVSKLKLALPPLPHAHALVLLGDQNSGFIMCTYQVQLYFNRIGEESVISRVSYDSKGVD